MVAGITYLVPPTLPSGMPAISDESGRQCNAGRHRVGPGCRPVAQLTEKRLPLRLTGGHVGLIETIEVERAQLPVSIGPLGLLLAEVSRDAVETVVLAGVEQDPHGPAEFLALPVLIAHDQLRRWPRLRVQVSQACRARAATESSADNQQSKQPTRQFRHRDQPAFREGNEFSRWFTSSCASAR